MTRDPQAREPLGGERRVEDELLARLGPALEERGLELVEITWRRERQGWVLRFTVDRVGGGFRVEDGVRLSRDLSSLIEADPHLDRLLVGPYHLEVSSPGIFRELKRPRDFERAWGKRVFVRWAEGPNVVREASGRLDGYGDGRLRLAVNDQTIEIDIEALRLARLDPELPF